VVRFAGGVRGVGRWSRPAGFGAAFGAARRRTAATSAWAAAGVRLVVLMPA
jgi:hypothetical protein